jgi:excisionase family DNA binding protein
MTLEAVDQSINEHAVVHDPRLDDLPMLITIARVAALLGISRSAAYRCAASGDLPTTQLGGRVYVVTAKLRELLEAA